jgi:protein-disulfide isomerase-like protein with CxxC motif
MERLGWFFNNEMAQRNAINEAAAAINAIGAARAGDAGTFARLFELDRAQAQEITAIKVTLEVLANLLIEAGIVDEKALRYRIEAAYAELEASQPPPSKPSAFETLGSPTDDASKP